MDDRRSLDIEDLVNTPQTLDANVSKIAVIDICPVSRGLIDPAGGVLVKRRNANTELVLNQWHVDNALDGFAHPAFVSIKCRYFQVAGEVIQIGIIRDVSDRTSHRTLSIESPLRPAKHFYSRQIEYAQIDLL